MSAGQVDASLIGILLIVGLAWVSWRRPTALLAVALASLSVRPQLFFGGAPVGYEWGLHHSLLSLALVVHALRFGIRRNLHWPVAALLASFVLSLTAGELHPKLTAGVMAMSLGVFALPWCCTSVILEPGSRRALALVIMFTPLLSVAVGAVMTAAGIRSSFPQWHRLEGATGNAAAFAILAFAGFAVALHEMSRPKRPFAGALAVINLALVVLSGTRMAIAASGVFLIAYLLLSDGLRQRLRQHRGRTAVGIAVIAAALLWYWPTLESRLFGGRYRSAPRMSASTCPAASRSGSSISRSSRSARSLAVASASASLPLRTGCGGRARRHITSIFISWSALAWSVSCCVPVPSPSGTGASFRWRRRTTDCS